MPFEPMCFEGAATAAEAALGADAVLVNGDIVMVYVRQGAGVQRERH
jgi:hypothetical protein